MSISEDIKALEEALAHFEENPGDIRLGRLHKQCSPDRIRRLLDALDERDGTVLRTMAAYRQEREASEKAEAWLSKAIELLKECQANGIDQHSPFGSRVRAFLREAGQ